MPFDMVNAHYVIIDFRAKFFIKIQNQASDTSRSLPSFSSAPSVRFLASDLGKSITLNEWRFSLSFSCVSKLFLNSCSVSVVPYYVTAHPPAIQKQNWHSKEAQIEPPLIECECEWAFRIQA
jgi:hypothetical protein